MSDSSSQIPPGDLADRPVRVVFPVRVEFAAGDFMIRELTTNLSVTGAFIATTSPAAPGSMGRLTFRYSRWEKPFTVKARVVRVVDAETAGEENPAGMAVHFEDVKSSETEQLRRMVAGLQEGSVTEAIRRTVRLGNRPLLEELRRRPADQKVIFARAARGPEIDDVIRDGNPAAVSRLLDNPSLGKSHLHTLLKDTRTPVRTLLVILRNAAWVADEESRFLLCCHPLTPLPNVLRLMPTLSTSRLQALARLAILRQPIRSAAQQALRTRK